MKKLILIIVLFLSVNFLGYAQNHDTVFICFSDMGNASYKIFYENKLIGRVESSRQKKKHNFIKGFRLFHIKFHWYKKFSIHYVPLLLDSVSFINDSIQLEIFRKPFFGLKYSKTNFILDPGNSKKYLIFTVMVDVTNDRKKKVIVAFWSCCKPRFI